MTPLRIIRSVRSSLFIDSLSPTGLPPRSRFLYLRSSFFWSSIEEFLKIKFRYTFWPASLIGSFYGLTLNYAVSAALNLIYLFSAAWDLADVYCRDCSLNYSLLLLMLAMTSFMPGVSFWADAWGIRGSGSFSLRSFCSLSSIKFGVIAPERFEMRATVIWL